MNIHTQKPHLKANESSTVKYHCGRWKPGFTRPVCGNPAERFVLTTDVVLAHGLEKTGVTRPMPICNQCMNIDNYANPYRDVEITEEEYWVHRLMEE